MKLTKSKLKQIIKEQISIMEKLDLSKNRRTQEGEIILTPEQSKTIKARNKVRRGESAKRFAKFEKDQASDYKVLVLWKKYMAAKKRAAGDPDAAKALLKDAAKHEKDIYRSTTNMILQKYEGVDITKGALADKTAIAWKSILSLAAAADKEDKNKNPASWGGYAYEKAKQGTKEKTVQGTKARTKEVVQQEYQQAIHNYRNAQKLATQLHDELAKLSK